MKWPNSHFSDREFERLRKQFLRERDMRGLEMLADILEKPCGFCKRTVPVGDLEGHIRFDCPVWKQMMEAHRA